MTILVWPPTSTTVTGSATELTALAILAAITALEARVGGSLVPEAYDYIGVNTAGALTDVLTYRTGGAGGAVVKTVTITYSAVDKLTVTSTAAV